MPAPRQPPEVVKRHSFSQIHKKVNITNVLTVRWLTSYLKVSLMNSSDRDPRKCSHFSAFLRHLKYLWRPVTAPGQARVAPVSVVELGGDTTTVGQGICGSANGVSLSTPTRPPAPIPPAGQSSAAPAIATTEVSRFEPNNGITCASAGASVATRRRTFSSGHRTS